MELGPGSLSSISSHQVSVHSARLLSGWAVGQHPWACKSHCPVRALPITDLSTGTPSLVASSLSLLCPRPLLPAPCLLLSASPSCPLPSVPQGALHPPLSTHLPSPTLFHPIPRDSRPLLPGAVLPCALSPRTQDSLPPWKPHPWDPLDPCIPGTPSLPGTPHPWDPWDPLPPSAPGQHTGRCPARIQGQDEFRLRHHSLVHRHLGASSAACSRREDAPQVSLPEWGPPGLQGPFAGPGLMPGAAPSSLGTLVLGTEPPLCPGALQGFCTHSLHWCSAVGNTVPGCGEPQEQWVRAGALAPARNRDFDAVKRNCNRKCWLTNRETCGEVVTSKGRTGVT